jgi:hypothetical protein
MRISRKTPVRNGAFYIRNKFLRDNLDEIQCRAYGRTIPILDKIIAKLRDSYADDFLPRKIMIQEVKHFQPHQSNRRDIQVKTVIIKAVM